MAQVGQFIRASVPFEEKDGRSKVRPCLVLAKARHEKGIVFLCAPLSTQTAKSHGGIEVVLRREEAASAGLTDSSVVRFERRHLVPVLASDVANEYGRIGDLPASAQRAIKNAAKSLGCVL